MFLINFVIRMKITKKKQSYAVIDINGNIYISILLHIFRFIVYFKVTRDSCPCARQCDANTE